MKITHKTIEETENQKCKRFMNPISIQQNMKIVKFTVTLQFSVYSFWFYVTIAFNLKYI